MATREIATSDSYTNWASGHPKPGYVYMDAATGKWKTEYSAATRVTLCVELERGELPFIFIDHFSLKSSSFMISVRLPPKTGLSMGLIDKHTVKKLTPTVNLLRKTCGSQRQISKSQKSVSSNEILIYHCVSSLSVTTDKQLVSV